MSQPIDSKILRTLQREIKQSLKEALEKLRISFLFASLILMLSPAAMATEGGGTSKALGVDTVLAGVMPPPGHLQIENFLAFYTAGELLDSSGNERPGISDFDLFIFAETLRFRYILPRVEIFGANLELRFGWTAVADADVSFDVHTPFGTFHREDSTINVGDSLVGLILGWHSEHYHQMFGVDIFMPTGRFSERKLVNTSRGYWSIGPAYWFTWFPIKQIEVSGTPMFLINFENPDTNYTSGKELTFDYNLGYFVTPDWEVGISGYAYKQVLDDEINGHTVGDGNRGLVVAFGPALRWAPHGKNFGLALKWQHEEAVENRTKGERVIFQGRIQF